MTITNDDGSFSTNRAYQIVPVDLECNLWVIGDPAITYVSNWNGAWNPEARMNGDWCSGFPESNGYGFKIASGFDLNRNLALEGSHISTWIAEPADFDADDDADNTDLLMLVGAVTSGGE